MRRPPSIVYGVEDKPPFGVTILCGLQHVGLISIFLLFPLLIGREAELPYDKLLDLLSLSMIAMAVGAVLPALHRGPVGSGFLCPATFTAAYIGPSLLALKTGGLSLVFGMTIFGGFIEVLLSRLQRKLRPLFPPEIAGLVVVMVGFTIGAIGLRYILGIGNADPAGNDELAVAFITLAVMVGLNVWTRGFLLLLCALIGMIVGYLVAVPLGTLSAADFDRVIATPLVSVPSLSHLSWSFDTALMVPFAIGALAACLKTVGNIITCQKINDADWTRPSMSSIGKGVMADGCSTVVAGVVGTVGVNSSPSSVGLSSATGVTSRYVAYAIGGIFFVLAFLPKASSVLAIMPRPVMGAVLLFAASFVLVNGLEIITTRLLDARRIFVIGLSFMLGISVDLFPDYLAALPEKYRPLTSSALALGMLTAVLLNLVFRLGVRRTGTLLVAPDQPDARQIEDFMETQGAAWGARRDVVERAKFNLSQSIETIAESCDPQSPMEVQASFDEFNLDVRVSYTGAPLELPDKRPSNEEIIASDDGQRKLAGFMLRRHADRVSATHKAGRSTVLFHFDH